MYCHTLPLPDALPLFGGGTPSLFPPDAIDRFLQQASSRLRFAPECEVTLETNPGTAEHGRFEGYRDAGVNRLSFGVQRSEEHTSELQSLMRSSYAVFCLNKITTVVNNK